MLFKDKFKKFLKVLFRFFVVIIMILIIGYGFYNSKLVTEGRKNQIEDLIGNNYISSDLKFKLQIKNEDTISYRYPKKIDGIETTLYETKNFIYNEGTFFIETFETNDEGVQEVKELKIICLSNNRLIFLKFNKTLYLTT